MATHGDKRFTIRRKVFKIFGAAFHVYGPQGNLIAYCRQKAFRLREDIRLYTDESESQEFLALKTRQVIDFGATYDVALPDGQVMASLRRKGMKSILRDSWTIYGPTLPEGQGAPAHLADIQEDSTGLAMLRRFVGAVALLAPQKFTVRRPGGPAIATLRTHFNPFVHRMTVHMHREDPEIDDLALLAAGVLLVAIEGRQD